MAMDKVTVLILGVKFNRYDNKLGYDPIMSDDWLPYIEGHEGVKIGLRFGENTNDIYLGVVLAESDSYAQGGLDEPVAVKIPSDLTTMMDIQRTGYPVEYDEVQIWFVDLWR